MELIPGPGCPVRVCPEEDVFQAIQLAPRGDLTLATFGDMLRVPVKLRSSEIRTLEQAWAAGADVRPVASPLEAVALARAVPDRTGGWCSLPPGSRRPPPLSLP
jgi:hydrogenase expression/formation protein HypD